MKKIISLVFVVLLISSCWKAENDIKDDTNTPIQKELPNEINNESWENIDWDIKVVWDDDSSVEVTNWENTTSVKVTNWENDIDINVDIDNTNTETWETMENTNEEELIEDAIKEIDNIINEIESDVK